MRSTPETETTELTDARAALQDARHALLHAQREVAEAGAPRTGPLADAAEARWVRVALLERRERDALAAQARGDRRRGRTGRWRRAFGLAPAAPPRAEAPPTAREAPTVHEATTSFLDQSGRHDTGEDLHPSALDPVQADLQEAIARSSLAKRNAEREARDA